MPDWVFKGSPKVFDTTGYWQQFPRFETHPLGHTAWGPIRYNRDRLEMGDNVFVMSTDTRRTFAGGANLGLYWHNDAEWWSEFDRTGEPLKPGWYVHIELLVVAPEGVMLPDSIDDFRFRHSDLGQRNHLVDITRKQRVALYRLLADADDAWTAGSEGIQPRQVG